MFVPLSVSVLVECTVVLPLLGNCDLYDGMIMRSEGLSLYGLVKVILPSNIWKFHGVLIDC